MTGPVLCAVDVSNPHQDEEVLRRAARLAELDGAQLDVITVVPDYGMSVVGSYFGRGHHEKLEAEARRLLNELVGEVLKVMQSLAEEGRTMIVVTHEMAFARDVSSQVLFLHQGVIEEQGTPDKVFDNPDSERMKQFLAPKF